MRVVMSDAAITGPCTVVNYGEVEDYFISLSKVGNTVFEDRDYDGYQDVLEPGIKNVPITLQFAGADGILNNGDPYEFTYRDTTDANGRYAFKTIRPGAYPAEDDWWRPPHIHFKVARRGYRELTTQMYFEGEALNDVDRIVQNLPEAERVSVIAKRVDAASPYVFDIVIAKV